MREQVCSSCGNTFNALFDETVCPNCRGRARIEALKTQRVCLECGGPVEKNRQLCDKCKSVANRVESVCVVCGKKFLPKRTNCKCKTCSRTCQGLYVQAAGYGMKYNTDELHAKIIEHIKAHGAPMSLDDLGIELGGITRKVFYARGWSVRSLMKDAGIETDWLTKGTSIFERAIYYIIREVIGDDKPIEVQKKFEGLKGAGGGTVRFDFYLPDFNLIVEADGRQPYMDGDPWGGDNLKENDIIKNNYCYNNGIGLLRVRYERYTDNKENIKNVLINILPPNGEIRKVNCFNCWNGSELIPIPISNQAPQGEGSQTIP